MKVTLNTLTPELFLELYTSVGWEPPGKDRVEAALKNTLAGFTAFDEDKPLRMGRSRNVQNDTLIITHKNRNAPLRRITVLLSSIQKNQTLSSACLTSAIMSSTFSRPTDNLISPPSIPAAASCSSVS